MSFSPRSLGSILIFLLVSFTCNGQYAATPIRTQVSPRFTENKGQIIDQEGKARNDIRFFFSAPGFKMAMMDNSLSYEVYTLTEKEGFSEATGEGISSRSEKPKEYAIRSQRIDITFPGCNPHPEIIPEGRSNDYCNYYQSHCDSNGITYVHSYDRITYKNIYPGIDLVFYAKGNDTVPSHLKYDIVVRPEGMLEDLKMCYNGTGGMRLSDGKLILHASTGSLSEEIPVSYIEETRKAIQVSYGLEGNTVSFNASYKNDNQTLVIDPYLVWSTYFGSDDSDHANDIVTGESGTVYITGYTESSSNIATSGSHQASFGGDADAYIAEFDTNGVRKWATYYGGSGYDFARSLAVDLGGNIFIIGETSSDSNSITTTGAHQRKGSGEKAMLIKFNRKGVRKWGTIYGSKLYPGSLMDGMDVATDKSGSVYITGWTNVSDNLPTIATSGSYQYSFIGGKPNDYSDGFLVKFDSLGKRIWGTFYGGSENDYAFSIGIDPSDNIYIAGHTLSTTKIATSGGYKTSHAGGKDLFLAKFTSGGNIRWATYYGGSSDDFSNTLAVDSSANVYLTGYTSSSSGIATTGAHLTSLAGGTDAFLVKFDSAGALKWGTYYGGSSNDDGYGVITDKSGNVYLSGTTQSSSGIATAGTSQTTAAGNRDAYVVRFDPGGKRLGATYYGGPGFELGLRIATDKSGYAYVVGRTGSDQWIATSKGYQRSRGGTSFDNDGFIAKFSISGALDTKIHALVSPEKEICPFRRIVSIRYKNNGNIQLDSVRIQWSLNGNLQPVVRLKDKMLFEDTSKLLNLDTIDFKAGTYDFKFWTFKPNGQKDDSTYNDTLKIKVIVHPLPEPGFSFYDSCVETKISFMNSSKIASGKIVKYLWKFGDTTTDTARYPIHVYKTPGKYTAWLIATSDFGCVDSISKTFTIYPRSVVDFLSDSVCLGETISFVNKTTVTSGTLTYLWSFGDSKTSTQIHPSHIYGKPGIYTVKLWATTDKGCVDSFISQAEIYTLPEPGFRATDTCFSTPVSFANNSSINAGKIVSYLWDFGDGDTSSAKYPAHTYAKAGKYKITLTAVSDKGCAVAYSDTVTAWDLPVATFETNKVCAGSDIYFTNKSTIASGSVSKWEWSFGDGKKSSLKEPAHLYAKPGKYEAMLTVWSDKGCSDTQIDTITVFDTLIVDFETANVCLGNSVSFIDHSSAGKGNISAYLWLFGDGDSSTMASPVHFYDHPGTYIVTLGVTSDIGCTGYHTDTVTVYDIPIADFISDTACKNEAISFSNKSKIGTGSIISFAWDFGDSTKSALENPTHVYSKAGTYIVTLGVTSDLGCTGYYADTLNVYDVPVADFTSDTACENEILSFSNKSKIGTGSIEGYEWNFGDSSKSTLENPTHVYGKAGDYIVMLKTVSQGSCYSTISKTVKIHPYPKGGFSFTATGLLVSTTATDTAQKSYSWDWGDGAKSTGFKSSHIYASAGTYAVKLTTVSPFDCAKDSTISVTVKSIGIAGAGTKPKWKVYPNPVLSGFIIIEGPMVRIEAEIQLLDMQGKCVLKQKTVIGERTKIALPQGIDPGSYTLKILYRGVDESHSILVN